MKMDNTTIPRSLGLRRIGIFTLCTLFLMTSAVFYQSSRFEADKVYAEDNYNYTSDQFAALAFLNEIRVKAGVKPLKLNAAITKAAVSHAAYFNTNNTGTVTLSAHDETAGMPGFTGVRVIDRMMAAGWSKGTGGYAYGEVMHFDQKSSSQAIQGWLDTAYHRAIVLSSSYDEVGVGLVDGTAVMDFGGKKLAKTDSADSVYVYPYDKQTNVGVGFYGYEIPNPLQQFAIDYSGYIISASAAGKLTAHEANITDENGVEVPFYEEEYHDDTLFLFPKKILKGNHTYTVTLDYEVEGMAGKKHKVWSFKTGEGHKLSALSPKQSQIVMNEGETRKLEFQGMYDDGVTEPLVDGLTYTSNNTVGLHISSDGEVKGLKAGNSYSITAKSGEQSTKISVRILPKLKTKAYQGITASSTFKDISGHAAASSIEWAITNGVMAGYKDGTFRPDVYVSEAEFWTMLLKTYKVDINAYTTAVKKHWSDPAYKIAADRGFALDGMQNIARRNTPITRLKVAEILASADGVKFTGYNNVQYVLAMGYMRGKQDSTLSGFGGSDQVTRAEAAQLLEYVQPRLMSLRGRPGNSTPESELPPMPEKEVYLKPAVLSNKMIAADFHADHTLTVEGTFKAQAGKQLNLKVQTGGQNPEHIEDVAILMDAEGHFTTTVGPYEQESLNIYLYTDEVTYWIPVHYNSTNVNQF